MKKLLIAVLLSGVSVTGVRALDTRDLLIENGDQGDVSIFLYTVTVLENGAVAANATVNILIEDQFHTGRTDAEGKITFSFTNLPAQAHVTITSASDTGVYRNEFGISTDTLDHTGRISITLTPPKQRKLPDIERK